ncbi:MAG: ABC transporter permease, partial [Clostridium sp.]|nr:ABC transporter permease [Clostridium sp.]
LEKETGKVLGKAFVLENKEDMVRLANTTGNIGAAISMNDQGELAYDYYTQGYETKQYTESLYIVHAFVSEDVDSMLEQQITRQIGIENAEKLNNRESFVPIFIAFSGALMGFFIIMSYVFLDKNEGVIKAFAVTPSAVWKYLLSKIFVILTTVIISSSIVVIPIMGLKPNYPLFYLFLMVSSFAFSSLGLLVASFFDSISKAFGVLYLIMIAMMLPGFSYYIGSFDPVWLRFFPTYPLLEGFKGIMTGSSDVGYVLGYSLVFVAGGIILLALSNIRFKKLLTV